MEKSNNVFVVPLDAGWSDIGSWSALYDISKSDNNGNVIKGDVIVKDTVNTYIDAKHHMVATIGLDNIVIIDTPDVTFVSSKEKAHEVKIIADKLKSEGRSEILDHRKVYRPWGWYDSIEVGENFQVKRLHVNPGAKLSLQMHYKRAEHWVVVTGMATVVNGDEKLILKKGESTFIPIGVSHSLANNTSDNLEIIEIQSGVYLGEDDIIRFEDIYGRLDNNY
jgi:mannose-1-phosphate guanylyltransferase/mannose-6-phosphate isomerase